MQKQKLEPYDVAAQFNCAQPTCTNPYGCNRVGHCVEQSSPDMPEKSLRQKRFKRGPHPEGHAIAISFYCYQPACIHLYECDQIGRCKEKPAEVNVMTDHIDYPAYVPAAILARDALRRVMREAKALLPPAVAQQHFIAGHHSPTAWRSVEKWYSNQPDAQTETMTVLSDLALMAEALSCLLSVTTHREDTRPMGSLKLAKARRVEM